MTQRTEIQFRFQKDRDNSCSTKVYHFFAASFLLTLSFLLFRFTDKGQVKQSLRSSQVTPVDLNMFCCWLSEEFREFSFSGFSDQRSGM